MREVRLCSVLTPLLGAVTEVAITLVTMVVVMVVILRSRLDLIPQDTAPKVSSRELPPRESVWTPSSSS